MIPTQKIYSFLISLLLALTPLTSSAQSSLEIEGDQPGIWVNDNLAIGDITVTSKTVDTIQGTFVIKNKSSNSFGDLHAQVALYEPEPTVEPNTVVQDTARLLDRTILPDTITLLPNEEKTIPFVFSPIALPLHTYRLRVQTFTSQGQMLTWDNIPIEFGNSDVQFLTVDSGLVLTSSFPKGVPSLNGVNVDPNSDIRIGYTIHNPTAKSIIATPVLTSYIFDIGGKVAGTTTSDAVSLQPNETKEGEMKIRTMSIPTAYYSMLRLASDSGAPISSIAEFRWVVKGASGKIVFAHLKNLVDTKALLEVGIVGPADRETSVTATLTASILDSNKEVGVVTSNQTLLDSVGMSVLTLDIPLNTALSQPSAHLILKDDAGKVLDEYGVAFTGSSQNTATPSPVEAPKQDKSYAAGRIAIILAILSMGIALVVWIRIRKPVLLVCIAISGALFAGIYHNVRANEGIQVGSVAGTRGGLFAVMTIRQPLHDNQVPYDARSIPVDFTMVYAHCNNRTDNGEFRVLHRRGGGKDALVGSVYYNGDISTLKITSPFAMDGAIPGDEAKYFQELIPLTKFDTVLAGSPCGEHLCPISNSFTGKLAVDSKLKNTTIVFLAYNNRHGEALELTAYYTWANFILPSSDLAIVKTGPSTLEIGKPLRYILTVTNPGPAAASNIVVKDPVPAGLTFNPSASSLVCKLTGQRVTCSIPKLAADATRTFILWFTSGPPTATCTANTISNTASVSSDNPDPIADNNSSTVTTNTTCPVPVTVNLLINGSKTPAPVSVNTPITHSWASTNADTCAATGDWTGSKVVTGSEVTTPITSKTYTYTITCTNTASGRTGTDTASIAVNALAGDANKAPVAVATIGLNGGVGSSTVTVQQGVPVQVTLGAEGSSDPDGWTAATKGVSTGGKCEWNSDLNQGSPTYEQAIQNPPTPASCNISLGSLTFNDAPGSYTYQLLKITDAAGATSNSGAATVIVTDGPTPTPSPILNVAPTTPPNNGGFEETR